MGTLQKFAEEYNIHVRRAIRRYEKGVPATVEMPDRDNTGAGVVIQVTQDILEFKDMLFLKMTDIDQVRHTSASAYDLYVSPQHFVSWYPCPATWNTPW